MADIPAFKPLGIVTPMLCTGQDGNRAEKVTLYLCGPMTGYPDFNRPAFYAAAEHLQAAGFHVVNPADLDEDWEWPDYMRVGIERVLSVAGVAVLPGWEASRGAALEVAVAHALDLPVWTVSEWLGGPLSC